MDGRDLKVWRKRHGLTQAGLARALGVHPRCVAHWEQGLRRIPAMLPLALKALEGSLMEVEHGTAD